MEKLVNPEMITLARESRGIKQNALAASVGVTRFTITRIEKGQVETSPGLLKKISEELAYPEDFFFEEPNYSRPLSFSFYRKNKSFSATLIKQVGAIADTVALQLKKIVPKGHKLSPLIFERKSAPPEQRAQNLRGNFDILQAIDDVTRIIEKLGILVLHFDFGEKSRVDGLDAFHLKVEELPPLIFINKYASGDRLRFNLAHELGHILLHDVYQENMEEEANSFAAEFLMPEREIRSDLEGLRFGDLYKLKSKWRVSMAALVYRAKNLGCISENTYKFLFTQLSRLGYRKKEPVALEIEKPKLVQQYLKSFIEECGSIPEACKKLKILEPDFDSNYSLTLGM